MNAEGEEQHDRLVAGGVVQAVIGMLAKHTQICRYLRREKIRVRECQVKDNGEKGEGGGDVEEGERGRKPKERDKSKMGGDDGDGDLAEKRREGIPDDILLKAVELLREIACIGWKRISSHRDQTNYYLSSFMECDGVETLCKLFVLIKSPSSGTHSSNPSSDAERTPVQKQILRSLSITVCYLLKAKEPNPSHAQLLFYFQQIRIVLNESSQKNNKKNLDKQQKEGETMREEDGKMGEEDEVGEEEHATMVWEGMIKANAVIQDFQEKKDKKK
jgi:hypothetical protein